MFTRTRAEIREAAHRICLQIAIDGPAGAGKSTVGRALAEFLGCPLLDTGLMYRAVTLLAHREGVPPSDEDKVTALAGRVRLSTASTGGGVVLVDGEQVGEELRTPEVDRAVSEVSAHPRLRRELVRQQQEFAGKTCVVMVGRDIGTVVLPHAPVKFWVTASPEERAARRLREGLPETRGLDVASMAERIRARDELDASRPVSPLRPASNARALDTETNGPDQVLERALAYLDEVVAGLDA